MMTTQEWIEELKSISVAELHARIKLLEETFGVSPNPEPTTLVHVPGDNLPAEPEEQTAFTVVLLGVPDVTNKIQVIKLIRETNGLGLREGKAFVDEAPSVLKGDIARDDAEALKKKFVDAGAEVELR
jgi:large subunit ribosomal protein L7/L12